MTGADTAIADALADWIEEAVALDDLIAPLDPAAIDRVTPHAGWTIGDVLRHLIALDEDAVLALAGSPDFAGARAAMQAGTAEPVAGETPALASFLRLRRYELGRIAERGQDALLARWRAGRVALAAAAQARGEDGPIEWFGPPMQASRLIAARQMETWCYGQDVHDALDVRRINRDRLRRIADFGVRTRSFAFKINALEVPPAPFIRLFAPSARVWEWGAADAADRVEGTAEDFALVVTQRRNVADTRLTVTGEGAARWMRIAQTIAGAPHAPPAPGLRATDPSAEPALPHAPTVPAAIAWLAARYGGRPQIIDAEGEACFAELEAQSRALARGLLARGVAKGARVGILMPNGRDFAVALLAAQRIGLVAVLLSTFARGEELAHLVRHADLHMLLMRDRDFAHDLTAVVGDALPELADWAAAAPLTIAAAPFLRAVHVAGNTVPGWARPLDDLVAAGLALPDRILAAAEAEVAAADPAVLIYTSGSAALPKAVLHSQGALVRQSFRMSAYTGFQPGDRLLTTMPLFWVGGLVTALMTSNYNGAALVCPAAPDAATLLATALAADVSHVALWPQQLAALLAQDTSGTLLARLRPMSAQHLGLFGFADAAHTPNALGMTETLGPHSMEYLGYPLPPGSEGSFGRRVGTIERAVIDRATGQPLPAGETGEIAVRGGHLMLGMHRRERDEVFTADGWYKTGDLGAIDAAGFLHFAGRDDDMVKSSGANISLREVELALAGLPGVQEAVTFGLPDRRGGEILVAAVVPRPGATLDQAALTTMLRAQLSSYKVPKRFHFLAATDIPRTASHKAHRGRLRAMFA
ncbi:AMP-binding protein [Sphingomonas immobilis]|uniref:AMP-binding protein n=1 Tax=Sphingomonas immobilis TaxID=3063997 RepID=A0ABT8ZZ67_9SPHN|nr:AMP-binding protein [Sphingomonas sp. CA1-15]MDO7842873.1 AMP-binding protein [Sphingomonas sp. CA1-15]